MADYRKSTTWQAAHRLVLAVYENTELMPMEERFGLQAQMRRAAVSVASNLVEGIGRGTTYAELRRFCELAAGSAAEVEYQAFLARELDLISKEEYDAIFEHIDDCTQLISGFRRWLRRRDGSRTQSA